MTSRPDNTITAAAQPALARSVALGATLALTTAVLTWIGANITIPLVPVPITLQTLFVLLAGSIAGSRWGATGQGLYVLAGGLGLPLFAGGASGFGILAGPTGGYLLSFFVTPFIVGAFIHRSTRLWWQTAVFTIATAVIFAMGLLHLTVFYTHDVAESLTVGLIPFLPGAALKIVAAVSIHRAWHMLVRRANQA